MIRRLRCVLFDEEQHLPKLQNSGCGAEDYEREIADWIKNRGRDCVLDDLRATPDLRVWVYILDDIIVGYGSMQSTKWNLRELCAGKGKEPVILLQI